MHNPWFDLPGRAPFVLPFDAMNVKAFNARVAPVQRIHLEAMPEPFLGRFEARVVVLMLNPGFPADGVDVPESAAHVARLRQSLATGVVPHLHLVPSAEGNGAAWWKRTTRALVAATSAAVVAEQLLTLEFSPYHSIQFAHGHLRFPSQDFTFHLLRAALARGAEVVVARGFEWWVSAVPELYDYARLHRPRSPQQSAMSAGNLGTESFTQVVSALSGGPR